MERTVQQAQAYEGGGIGGKFRRRIFRRSSTPYDRTPTATRRPSWMEKLVVDPASKLFNFGARRFFDAVFPNKRLPPPPPTASAPVEEQERRNGLQETALDVKINTGVQEPVGDVCGTSSINNDPTGLPELEQLLKRKNFSRSEIDRLTELLKSRADDLPVKDDRHGFKLNPSGQDSGRHQDFPTTLNINKSESSGAHGAVSDSVVTTRQHLEDGIASPAELAKAYMSSRPTKVSPSALGLRAQIAREDSVHLSNSPYTSKSQLSSLPVKTSSYSGVPENGFTTPRSRGRSAIYNMARTPYSRFNPVSRQKVSESRNYGDSRPLLLASSPSENGGQLSSKPTALKRRSTVLDEEIGSIGPIRRIRQKHNLLHHGKSVTTSGKGLGSNLTQSSNRYFMSSADTRGASSSSANYAHVPRESSEMAAKILEHLEKLTPKKKSLESKLAATIEGSTFKLAPHMLHGQALRSMEDLDSSKLLWNSHKDQKLVDQPVRRLPDFNESITQKQATAEEHGPVKSILPEDNLTPDRVVQGINKSNLGYGATLSFSSQPAEKKRPFKMSAHEDWIELDDDRCNDPGPELLGKGLEEPQRDSKSALNVDTTSNKSPVTLEKHATPVLSSTELKGDNVLAGENNTGFKFSTSLAPNTSSQKVLSQYTEVEDSHLLFSSGLATRNNLTSVVSKVETSSSLKNGFSGATNPVFGGTESDTIGTKNSELDNIVNGNLAKPPSLAFTSKAINNIVSVDGPSTLASNDGNLSFSSFSSSGPASVNLSNQSFTNSSSNLAASVGATTSTSALSDSVLVPGNGTSSSLSEPISDNRFSTKLFSAPSTIGSSEAADVKAEKVNGLGNFSNSPTVSTFAGASTGFSIFGVGTSASSSSLNSQWPSSASGTSVSKESSLTGSGSANVSLSTPVNFGSSSSSMVFGSSGVVPGTASISCGSSVPATKSEGTTQSSATALTSNPVNSTNGGAASASLNGNIFGSTTTASLGTFQFGASSATPTSLFSFNAGSPASSSAISSNNTAPGVFSFGAGAGSSSSATSVSSTTSGIFNFGSSTTAPAIFSFGASAPAPSSDSNKVSSSSPNSSTFASSLQAPTSFVSPFTMPSSTGFSFGASSPAFGSSNSTMVFGSNNGAPPNPTFSFASSKSSALPSAGPQSVFGNSASPFTTTPGNNDQMSAEDCMAEDPIHSPTPAAPIFGQSHASSQSLVSQPPGFMFPSTAPSPGAPFQFATQQSQVGQQNPPQFQASGSLEFNAGGSSFSLGSSDKSGRKFVKVNRNRNLRKPR